MQLIHRREARDPFREMEELTDRLQRWLGPNWFGPSRSAGLAEKESLATADWWPACDVSETDKEYRIVAELPNVRKDDVHVTIDDKVLTIEGERRAEKEERGASFLRRELSYGNFVRRFTLPENVDDSKIDASFKDGMLNLTVGKSKSAPTKVKEISIH